MFTLTERDKEILNERAQEYYVITESWPGPVYPIGGKRNRPWIPYKEVYDDLFARLEKVYAAHKCLFKWHIWELNENTKYMTLHNWMIEIVAHHPVYFDEELINHAEMDPIMEAATAVYKAYLSGESE